LEKLNAKKAWWLLIPFVVGASLIGGFNEWAPLGLVLITLLFVLLLKGMESFQRLYFLAIPLSFDVTLPDDHSGLIFPSELMAGILFVFTLFNILTNSEIKFKLLAHPVSFSLLLLWIGIAIATCYSNLPMVSIKSLLVFTVYLVVFYFHWFCDTKASAQDKIMMALKYYFMGLLLVVLMTIFKHAEYGFSRASAMNMPPPFFSDHTLYGSCLAFFIPLSYYWYKTSTAKLFYLISFLTLGFAIFLTYSRAVWMSLVAVVVLYYLLHLKISFKRLSLIFLSLLILVLLFQDSAVSLLSGNRSDSKARRAQVSDQLKSVTNISTDVSNLERINRWKSAWTMFSQKPVTGYGPGTYQFNFIPFQKEQDKTEISVNYASNRFSQGMGGTAHSQYLLYAAESGLLAVLGLLATLFFTLKEGFALYYESSDEKEKLLIKALLGGYVTFVFHSFFNNFLDIDKAASLFLLFNAAIIVMASKKRSNKQPIKT
jgi:putative inorganic carbon (hco3(-)) transporter